MDLYSRFGLFSPPPTRGWCRFTGRPRPRANLYQRPAVSAYHYHAVSGVCTGLYGLINANKGESARESVQAVYGPYRPWKRDTGVIAVSRGCMGDAAEVPGRRER